MNTTEASAQSPKDTKLEEFDPVILGRVADPSARLQRFPSAPLRLVRDAAR
jgi:hypothetical protein